MKKYIIIGALLVSAITGQAIPFRHESRTPFLYDDDDWNSIAAAWQQAGQYAGGWIYAAASDALFLVPDPPSKPPETPKDWSTPFAWEDLGTPDRQQ